MAIARSIIKPSRLILVNEPTGSLDVDNRDEILSILEQLNENGKTIIIVSHDLEVASRCHNIIQLD